MNRDIIELREVIAKLVPILTGKGLVVTQRGSRAYVRINTQTNKPESVNIPNISENATPAFIRAIQGFIDHEVAHVLLTDFTLYGQTPGITDPVRKQQFVNVHNMLEDVMIEREIIKIFPGSEKNIHDLRVMFINEITKPALANAKSDKEKFIYLLVPVLRAIGGHVEFQDFLDAEGHWANPFVAKLVADFKPASQAKLKTCTTTRETLELTKEVNEILYPPAPPPPPPAPPKPPEPPKAPEPPKKQPEPKDDKKSEDKPEKEAGEGDGDGERDHSKSEEESDAEEGDDGEARSEEKSDDEADAEAGDDVEPEGDDEEEPAGAEEEDPSDADGDEGDDEADAEDDEAPGAEADDDADEENADGDDVAPGEDDDSEEDGDADEDDNGASGPGGDDEDEDVDLDIGGDDDGDGEGAGADFDHGLDDDDFGGGGAGGGDADSDQDLGGIDSHDDQEEDEGGAGGGVGAGSGKSMFDFEDDAFDEADMSSAMQQLISEQAVDEMTGEYVVFTRELDRIEPLVPPTDMNAKWVPALEEQVRSMTGRMQKDIERLMASQSHVIRTPGHKNGKLHAPSLFRVSQGDPRVFSQRQEHVSKDTAVSLVIDNSGSMGSGTSPAGNKMKVAMIAGYALSATLDRVNIAHEVLGFTTGDYYSVPASIQQAMENDMRSSGIQYDRVHPIIMPVYKDFAEKLTPLVKARIAYAANAQNGLVANVDGESLQYAAVRLLKRREKRKVMIVLSDGMPAGGRRSPEHLKFVVKQLTGIGIDCIGIGIMSDAVKKFYPKHAVLNDIDQLPGEVMTELKKILA